MKGNHLATHGIHGDPDPLLVSFFVGKAGHFIRFHRKLLDCSGQVKTDTQLSNQSQLFKCIGTNIPERGMLPSAIVEQLDVINDLVPGLLMRGVITMRCPRPFYTAKESLSHRLVETLALLTRATDDPMVG